MQITPTVISDVLLVEPRVFGDDRGFFYESFNEREWFKHTGLDTRFVQNNHSRSLKNVLRGLHYQIQHPQGKLVRAVIGEIFDVAVDLRRNSATFGKWVGDYLSAANKKSLWIPEGFGHGFVVVSDVAEVVYNATDFYSPEHERCILWSDDDLRINWPLDGTPLISEKDEQGTSFRAADVYEDLLK
jgi:dTDP-4-dehydrorhamnose 3,5-epimerase